ncbi:hypothetical protein CRE_19104 [Caenorhabditis remanei]|uniref:Uncharacterized protein n=1 Tax=Caenorhabditis remanei TaxID=31234 RepID=E3MJC3_CAERE|nr:hypothetical protein CRE_19104 [Caenorhabditis remanei]
MQEDNDKSKVARKRRRVEEKDSEEEDSVFSSDNYSVDSSAEGSIEYNEEDGETDENISEKLEEVEAVIEYEDIAEENVLKETKTKESANEDIIDRALRYKDADREGFGKDIGILICATTALAVMIYLILTLLGLTAPARPLVVSKGATKPFFLPNQRRYIEDSYDGSIRLSTNLTMSVVLLYSPYSIKAKWFREEYYNTAKAMKKLHGDWSPYFGATNCFDTNSYCRRKYNLKKYPAIMAQNSGLMGSVYNGPLNAVYMTRWLNRLQNAVFRLHSPEDLTNIARTYDLIVILYHEVRTPPTGFQSAHNFTKLAYHYLDGDPNSERTMFCVVNDAKFAAQLQLHNEHDVVIVSSELKLLGTHYKGWTIDSVVNDLYRKSKEMMKNRIEFLNLGKRFHSTQLVEKFQQSSVLLFFTKNIRYGNERHQMLRDIVLEYRNCPMQDLLSIEVESSHKFVNNCSISVQGAFCNVNNTLSFMMIDSEVENVLAAKYGADIEDMIVAINSKQEITRYMRGNITREKINCLIHQHHNVADNEFITESTSIIMPTSEPSEDIHCDAVGEPSMVKFVDNPSELLKSRKINVILFSGGIWHSASSSAIAPFHLVANHFKESRNLIDFSMVDASETNLPYNLDFEKLPKILITSADSVGLSWTYPEEFMINHTNIARFVLSRPGKIFGRLRWMDSCQGACRKRAQWQMRRKRLQLKRQLSRNVANSMRPRIQIGYYDRMLRMIS